MNPDRLSLRQKRSLYRDGFVVLPGLIDRDHVAAARQLILEQLEGSRTPASKDRTDPETHPGRSPLLLGLFNDSPLKMIIEEVLGPVGAPRGCQLATRLPAAPGDHVNESGYVDRDTPFLGWHGHLDGLWNGATRIHQNTDRPMTSEEAETWNREPSTNGCLKTHPDLGANIRSFAALVAVSLSDQTAEGSGNLGVLRGAHHEIERFLPAPARRRRTPRSGRAELETHRPGRAQRLRTTALPRCREDGVHERSRHDPRRQALAKADIAAPGTG